MYNTIVVSKGRFHEKLGDNFGSAKTISIGHSSTLTWDAKPLTSSFSESELGSKITTLLAQSSPLSQTATILPPNTPSLQSPTPPPSPPILRPPPNSSSPSSSSLSHSLTGNPKNSHLPPLVGGLVGGSIFLVLGSILVFLKCRHWRTGQALDRAQHGRITWPVPAVFRRPANIQNLVADPIPTSGSNPTPPESKRGRLERTRLELEEAQRLRDAFQLNLDSRSSSNGLDDNSPDGGPDTAEFVAMRAQIQQMSVMIAALQAAVQQQAKDSQPPAYSTTIGH